MDDDQVECRSASSDQELDHSRCRRKAVHYASVGDFLSSLNINDTSVSSLQGLQTLTLEDYLRTMRNPEQITPSNSNSKSNSPSPSPSPSPPGDGNRQLRCKSPLKLRLGRDIHRVGSPDKEAFIPQYHSPPSPEEPRTVQLSFSF